MTLRNLPDPDFISRDPASITSEMIKQYETVSGKTLYPAQPERLLVDMAAYRETLVRIGVNEAAKLNLVRYSRAPILDYLGEDRGVTRLAASKAATTLRFTLKQAQSSDYLIAEGTRVAAKSGEIIFASSEAATVKAGELSADAAALCETAGSSGNGYLAGEIASLVAADSKLESANNLTVSSGGLDEEDDDRLRERIMLAPEGYAAAGPQGAYRYWTLSAHQSVVDASVVSPYPGLVCVYVLTTDGPASQELCSIVRESLNSGKRRPLTDQVAVLPAQAVKYSLDMEINLFPWANSEEAKAAVVSNLNSLAASLRLRLGLDVVASQLVTAAGRVSGVREAVLNSPGNLSLAAHQYADCQEISVNVTGFSDS